MTSSASSRCSATSAVSALMSRASAAASSAAFFFSSRASTTPWTMAVCSAVSCSSRAAEAPSGGTIHVGSAMPPFW